MKISCDYKTFEDDRGSLVAFDKFKNILLKRFYIIDCNEGLWRGDHYHKISTQIIGVIQGKLEVEISGDFPTQKFFLESGDMFEQSPGVRFKFRSVQGSSRLIVLCDREHDVEDYYT